MSKAVKHFRDLLFNYPNQIRYVVQRKDIENLIREIDEFTKVVDAVANLNYERMDSIRPMTNGACSAFHRLEDKVQEWHGIKWEVYVCDVCGENPCLCEDREILNAATY
jgi:hypothetical protein